MQDSSFTHVLAKGPYAGILESCIRAVRQNMCKSICALNLILLFCRAKYCINPTWDLCRTGTYAGLKFHIRFRERPLCRTQLESCIRAFRQNVCKKWKPKWHKNMRMWCEWGLHWSTTGEKDRFVLEILHKVKSCIRAFRQNRCVRVCVRAYMFFKVQFQKSNSP